VVVDKVKQELPQTAASLLIIGTQLADQVEQDDALDEQVRAPVLELEEVDEVRVLDADLHQLDVG